MSKTLEEAQEELVVEEGNDLRKSMANLAQVLKSIVGHPDAKAGKKVGKPAGNPEDDSQENESDEVDDAAPVDEDDSNINAGRKRSRSGDKQNPKVAMPPIKKAAPQGYETSPMDEEEDDDGDNEDDDQSPPMNDEDENDEGDNEEEEEEEAPRGKPQPKQQQPQQPQRPMMTKKALSYEEEIEKSLTEGENWFEVVEASAALRHLKNVVKKSMSELYSMMDTMQGQMGTMQEATAVLIQAQQALLEQQATVQNTTSTDNGRFFNIQGEAPVKKSMTVANPGPKLPPLPTQLQKTEVKDAVLAGIAEGVMKSMALAEIDYYSDQNITEYIKRLSPEGQMFVAKAVRTLRGE